MAQNAGSGFRKHALGPPGAQLQYVGLQGCADYQRVMPFGLARLDDGAIVLIGSAERAWTPAAPGVMQPVCFFSRDGGEEWDGPHFIPDVQGRPVGLACLGGRQLTCKCIRYQGKQSFMTRLWSDDGGLTWPERQPEQPDASAGALMATEGNPLAERRGGHSLLAEIACHSEGHPHRPSVSFLRLSRTGGRSWQSLPMSNAWRWSDGGGPRAVDEGALVRAADGALVAALRTNIPNRLLAGPHDDSLEGLAVSRSQNDGQSWSPLHFLSEAGRHHACLERLPDGRLVLCGIVRADVENGRLASTLRGCEARVSDDDGLTWGAPFWLDCFSYLRADGFWPDGMCGHVAMCQTGDGRLLTAYGNYHNAGATLVRWQA